MVQMKPYIYDWYKALADGKLTGVRCTTCGHHEFPPVPICNKCSSTDVEIVELSGKVWINTFTYNGMGVFPYSTDPVVCVGATLEEGPGFLTWLAPTDEDPKALAARMAAMELPISATVSIRQLDGEVYWPALTLAE